MREGEKFYWMFVALAWLAGVIAFWDIMSLSEGIYGTFAVFYAAMAVKGYVDLSVEERRSKRK